MRGYRGGDEESERAIALSHRTTQYPATRPSLSIRASSVRVPFELASSKGITAMDISFFVFFHIPGFFSFPILVTESSCSIVALPSRKPPLADYTSLSR